jgi:alpha-beta hydrolase superfamily lysophospholipase
VGSALRGADLLVQAIERQVATCREQGRNQKIVLAGYSQGALAILLALDRLSDEALARISAIVLIAPPVIAPGVLDVPDVPEELRERTARYCLPGDPVCRPDARLDELRTGDCAELRPACTHLHYSQPPSPGVPSETERAARFLAGLEPPAAPSA